MSITQAPARNPYHKPKTVNELTERNVELVAQLDETARAKRTPADCVVDGITAFCGSMSFIWVHALWFGIWIILSLVPDIKHFDPYPFQLLTLVVSLEAIFLSTFILISQNRQSRLAERRSHLDLQINLLSEQENTKILTMLEAIVHHFNIPDGDPEVSVLAESTEPERLVAQIEKVIEKESRSKGMNDGNEP
jgi:uncharacterized membrane protein